MQYKHTKPRERPHTRQRRREDVNVLWCQAVVERRKAGRSHMQNRDAWRCSARLITQADAAPQRSRETGRKKRDTAWMPGHVLVPASRYAHWPEVSWTLETTAVATWLQGASQCAAVGREGATHLVDQLERGPARMRAGAPPPTNEIGRKSASVFAKSESQHKIRRSRGSSQVSEDSHTSNQVTRRGGGRPHMLNFKYERVNDAMRSWTMIFSSTNTQPQCITHTTHSGPCTIHMVHAMCGL